MIIAFILLEECISILNLVNIYFVFFFQTFLQLNQPIDQILFEMPRNALHFLWGVQLGALIFMSIVNLFSYRLTWYRANRKDEFPTGINFFEPEISIIVCTKNEEKKLKRFLWYVNDKEGSYCK